MKILKALLVMAAIGIASVHSAHAHDSFHLGIQLGGFGYAPPPVVYHYSGPSAIYYGSPRYYGPPQVIHHAPIIQYNQFRSRHHQRHGGWDRGWDRGNRSRGSWDRGERGRGGWDRGHGRRGRD